MISRNELKYIQSLYHKKTRDKESAFIVEGPKMVEELLHSQYRIKKIWATPGSWLESHAHQGIEQITIDELHKASHFDTPNQVIAIAEKPGNEPKATSTIAPASTDKLVLMLDGLQDPGNFGTLMRIADWFGVDFIIASPDSADCYNPKVVQSTMGSIFRMPVYYSPLDHYLSNQSAGTAIYGALLNGRNLYQQRPAEKGILVIGNESKGIGAALLPFITEPVMIPSFGKAESLNAAVAAGIILSHLRAR